MVDQGEAIGRALARSRLYSLLSALFRYPEEGGIPDLDWGEAGEAVAALGNPGGLQEALGALGEYLGAPADLRSEYARIFGHTIQSSCPPYETQYGAQHGGVNSQLAGAQVFEQCQSLADIAGFYRAFGLEVSDRAKERFDHISIELEFMAFLAYKEAYALSFHGRERAGICREAQVKFLSDHLGRWAPVFAGRLAGEAGAGLYHTLACLAERFIAFEFRSLGVTPAPVEGPAPVPLAPEPTCFSCGITDRCVPGEGVTWAESSGG